MKQWISPPLNSVLSLLGLILLLLMLWELSRIQALSSSKNSEESSAISMSSTETLAIPPLRNYKMMLDAPLFWHQRTKMTAPVAVAKIVVEVPEKTIDRSLPAGRLIGIIDTGSLLMAVFNHENKSHYVQINEPWGAWKVSKIFPDAIELHLSGEIKRVELVSDYASPAANKNQQFTQKTELNRSNQALTESRRAKSPVALNNLPHVASIEKQVPPLAVPTTMTIKESLQTRQRLMAARWQKRK